MPNTKDVSPLDYNIYALFKGPSGSGKTVGALSFPGPIKLFDFDHKMPAIAVKHFRGKDIEYDTYRSTGELYDELIPWFREEKDCPFETIIFDSITYLAMLIMSTTAEIKGETIDTLMKSTINKKRGGNMIEPLSYDYYNSEVRFIEWLIGITKVLYTRPGNPKNIIFTAHLIESKSKPNIETKLVTVTRSIMSLGTKAPAIIPGAFDEIYMFGTSEEGFGDSQTKHMMFTQTTGEDDAKTAFNLAKMTDFTNKPLYDLLKAQLVGQEMFT